MVVDKRGVRHLKASRRTGHAERPRLVVLTGRGAPAHNNSRPPLVVLQGGAGRKVAPQRHPIEHARDAASSGMRVVREALSSQNNYGMATDDADRATRLLIADLLRLGKTDDLLARRLSRLLSTSKQEARKPQR